MFLKMRTENTMIPALNVELKKRIDSANVILIGAGAGLSTSAGFTYSGERFQKYFFDFAREYGIQDIYSGGFYFYFM